MAQSEMFINVIDLFNYTLNSFKKKHKWNTENGSYNISCSAAGVGFNNKNIVISIH